MSHWTYTIRVGFADNGTAVVQVLGMNSDASLQAFQPLDELFTATGDNLPDVLTQACRAIFEVEDS